MRWLIVLLLIPLASALPEIELDFTSDIIPGKNATAQLIVIPGSQPIATIDWSVHSPQNVNMSVDIFGRIPGTNSISLNRIWTYRESFNPAINKRTIVANLTFQVPYSLRKIEDTEISVRGAFGIGSSRVSFRGIPEKKFPLKMTRSNKLDLLLKRVEAILIPGVCSESPLHSSISEHCDVQGKLKQVSLIAGALREYFK